MALVRWRSPGDEMTRMERQMRQLFSEPFRMNLITEEMRWSPAVEVRELDDELLVTAELPGMMKDDVEVELEKNVLTIRGEKKDEKEADEKDRYLYERYYGAFQRSFSLPVPVDAARVRAEFKDGVLKIHLPKAPEAKGKKIEITA